MGPIDDAGHRLATSEQMFFEEVPTHHSLILLMKTTQIVSLLKSWSDMPIEMLLGFFVSLVVARWWEQYVKLPNPDKVATMLKAGINVDLPDEEVGTNERIRWTVARRLMLSFVLNLRRTSPRLKRVFPNMVSLVERGLLKEYEVIFWLILNFQMSSPEKQAW